LAKWQRSKKKKFAWGSDQQQRRMGIGSLQQQRALRLPGSVVPPTAGAALRFSSTPHKLAGDVNRGLSVGAQAG